eukprot:jgi/Mesen1/6608/ME000034S06064
MLARVRVVLVEPQGALNVGMVARTMANFGLSHLVLVRPGGEAADYKGLQARSMACHGRGVLESATCADTLAEALTGVTRTVAASGRPRGPPLPPLEVLRRPGVQLSPPTQRDGQLSSGPASQAQVSNNHAPPQALSQASHDRCLRWLLIGQSDDPFTPASTTSPEQLTGVSVRQDEDDQEGPCARERFPSFSSSLLLDAEAADETDGPGSPGGGGGGGGGAAADVTGGAILFGREDSGLTNHELSFAQRTLAIPTHPACPSMNLSHAVAEGRGSRSLEGPPGGGLTVAEEGGEGAMRGGDADGVLLLNARRLEGKARVIQGGSSGMAPGIGVQLDKRSGLARGTGEMEVEEEEAEEVARDDAERWPRKEARWQNDTAPAGMDVLEGFVQRLEGVLLETQFLLPHTAKKRMAKLRRLLLKAVPTNAEAALFLGPSLGFSFGSSSFGSSSADSKFGPSLGSGCSSLSSSFSPSLGPRSLGPSFDLGSKFGYEGIVSSCGVQLIDSIALQLFFI